MQNVNNFPRLETSRLILRPMELADAEAYWDLLSDPTAYPYITDSGPVSATQIQGRLSRNQELFVQVRAIYWALEYQSRFIGYVALHAPNEPTPALSYAILRRCRRQGFATEAIAAICQYAFSLLRSREKLPKLTLITAHQHRF